MKVLGIIGFVILFAAAASAQSNARLTAGIGTVEVQRGGVWLQLGPGEAINSGESLRRIATRLSGLTFSEFSCSAAATVSSRNAA